MVRPFLRRSGFRWFQRLALIVLIVSPFGLILAAEETSAAPISQLAELANALRAHRAAPAQELGSVVAAAERLHPSSSDASLRADVLNHLSWYYAQEGDAVLGLERAEEAQALAAEHGIPSIEALSHYMAAVSFFYQSRQDEALAAGREAAEGFEALGDVREQAVVHTLLGAVYRSRGDFTEAISAHWDARAHSELLGDEAGIARAQNNLGLIYWDLGQNEKARQHFVDAVDYYREAGSTSRMISALSNLGLVLVDLDLPKQAITHFEAALALPRTQRQRGMLLSNMSFAHEVMGEKETAIGYLRQAITIRRDIGEKQGLARNYGALGFIHQRAGELELAEAIFQEGLEIAEEADARGEQAEILHGLAQVYRAQGRGQDAMTALRGFLELKTALGTDDAADRIRELEAAQAVAAAELEVLQQKSSQRLLAAVGILLFLVCLGLWIYARSRERLLAQVQQSHVELGATARALAESEQRYRSLFDDTKEPRLLIDIESRQIIDINASAAALAGITTDEFESQSFERFAPDWLTEALDRGENLGETPLGVHEAWHTPEGEERFADVWFAPVPIDGRRCALVAVHDTTEDRRSEEDRIRSGKLESLGVLAGGIAHDFNNALSVVLGYVNMARDRLDDNPDLARLLSSAERSIDHAAKLSNQLLTFSKGGAPKRERHDLSLRLTEAARLATSGASVGLDIITDPDLWYADIDLTQFNQMVGNLIRNAMSAMNHKGVVRVSASNVTVTEALSPGAGPGDYVRIDVVDTGHGVPAEIQHRIMDPYFTSTPGNTGLGLAAAFAIASRHDGWLSFRSAAGEGSTFSAYLPAHVTHEQMTTQPDAVGATARRRVLVMDDDPAVCAMYEAALAHLDFDVLVTKDGEQAIEAYRASLQGDAFDVVIMDLTVPGGMGGRDALAEIVKLNPEVQAIVASGYSSDPVMSAYKEAGFRAALTKPFSLEALSDAIRELALDLPNSGHSASRGGEAR